MDDSWLSGTAYERYMGRWSRLVAGKFLSWLGAARGRTWLDVGCGTGSLTRLILEMCQPVGVFCLDPSIGFISHARRSTHSSPAYFSAGVAQSLPLDSNIVDAVVCGLVLNFVPQPEAAISEMVRVTRPGGQIGIFLWDYADGMKMLRLFWDAAVELDANARQFDEGPRFPLCQEGRLESLIREAGVKRVEAAPIEVETVFRNFDDYWAPFLGSVGPAPSYVMSLSQEGRERLKNRLREMLPVSDDGSIRLTARAWAVKGIA